MLSNVCLLASLGLKKGTSAYDPMSRKYSLMVLPFWVFLYFTSLASTYQLLPSLCYGGWGGVSASYRDWRGAFIETTNLICSQHKKMSPLRLVPIVPLL